MNRLNRTIVSGVLLITIGLITTIGIIISTKDNILASVNPMNLKASDIPYTNNSQSTVQGAIDELYTMAQPPLALNSTAARGTVFLLNIGSKKYACNSNINGKTICVTNGPANNTTDYNARVSALQTACTAVGGSFYSGSSDADCNDSSNDFICRVSSNGRAYCADNSSSHYCIVAADGSVYCA